MPFLMGAWMLYTIDWAAGWEGEEEARRRVSPTCLQGIIVRAHLPHGSRKHWVVLWKTQKNQSCAAVCCSRPKQQGINSPMVVERRGCERLCGS